MGVIIIELLIMGKFSIFDKIFQMHTSLLAACVLLAFVAPLAHAQEIYADGCIEYSAGLCIRCSEDTHAYLSLCYKNIIGCKKYTNGSICLDCDLSITTLQNGTCVLLPNQGPASIRLRQQIYRYGNPGDQYGEGNFIPTTYEAVKDDQTFIALNTFVRTGQYGHYISRVGNPVYSIHYHTNGNTVSYKVLYEGSGGGLFLCIADVDQNLKVGIRSLVVISLTQIVDYCIDYDISSVNCIRCQSGYHLESGRCYQNTGACLRYFGNICL